MKSLTRFAFALGALALAALPARGADELFPFVLPWDDATPSVTNLSGFLEKPAGAKGFVAARDGHLFAGDRRIRFFGVNVAFGGNFPSHEDAPKVAARMAKYGINCVRFHHMDTGTAPAGLLQKDRTTLDPESLDRLDFFISQLKGQGIYANLNLHVGNEYPGMPKWEGAPSYFKGVDNFYPPMIEQQRAYARALLTHVNPYTKLAYTADPAVAFIEINNENGLIMEWNNSTLDAMPDPYAREFRRQWNAWLQARYVDRAHLAAAWTPGEQPLGDELLHNPGFEEGLSGWTLEQHEGAKASTHLSDTHSLAIKVETAGQEGWHVQFNQAGLKLEAGKGYTVHLRARAMQPRSVTVSLSQAHAPWKVLATRQVKLTPEWAEMDVALVPSATDADARLSFSDLAKATGEVDLEQISLRPGGVLGLHDDEDFGSVEFFRKATLARRTVAAQQDWNRFLIDTELSYWPGMSRYIKEELGAHSLVLGSATGFSPWIVQSKLDVVDAHAYWQHPHFPHRAWDMNDWTVKNVPMAGDPDGGTLPGLALRRVAGKPFIVTEYNHSAPNTYSSEAFLEICAMAALQDWDGVFAFAYCHRLNDWDTRHITSFFDIDQHPTKMATLAGALTLFYRGDLAPASTPIVAAPSLEEAIESIRTGGSWVDGKAYGLTREHAFRFPIAMQVGGVSTTMKSDPGPAFGWDTQARRMLINTPRTAAVVGHVEPGETITLPPVSIRGGVTRQHWATINVTVIEGEDFAHATRLLVTATGDTENTAMRWKDPQKDSVGTDWGQAPSVVEGVAASVTFPGAPGLQAWALDERGQRRAEVPLKIENGTVTLELSPAQKTLWWEVARAAAH